MSKKQVMQELGRHSWRRMLGNIKAQGAAPSSRPRVAKKANLSRDAKSGPHLLGLIACGMLAGVTWASCKSRWPRPSYLLFLLGAATILMGSRVQGPSAAAVFDQADDMLLPGLLTDPTAIKEGPARV